MVDPPGGAYKDILIDGFVPPSTNVAPMFPFYENTFEWDDFGEVINPDDYVINDQDMDQAAMTVSVHIDIFTSLFLCDFSLAEMIVLPFPPLNSIFTSYYQSL